MRKKKLSLFSLVLLIIAAIDSIRNLPASALFGAELIFFFLLSAFLFLLPTSLVSAELSATFPERGGVYHWVDKAFGPKWAMIAIWLQWINTMVWYPTILSFIAGTAAYLINPDLAQNKTYLVGSILVVFWSITLVNLKGLHLSARINSLCVLLGTLFPILVLIGLGCLWIFKGKPLQIELTKETLLPSLGDGKNWIALIAIMASFLGFELSGVHVNEIHEPQKNFPKAVFFSSFFILFTMMFGSMAIAFVLPEKDINLVSGVMQVISCFFDVFGLKGLAPIVTVLIVMGSVGSIINWLIAPTKGLLHAAEFGFLPPFFKVKNSSGVPVNILIIQAVLVSIFCSLFLLVPSVNAFYWFLTSLSTGLYMMMYILMFLSALSLHYSFANRPKAFKIPGKHIGMWITCFLGLLGCSMTILVSFIPPENVQVGNPIRYIIMIATGNLLTILPVFFFFLYKKKKPHPKDT